MKYFKKREGQGYLISYEVKIGTLRPGRRTMGCSKRGGEGRRIGGKVSRGERKEEGGFCEGKSTERGGARVLVGGCNQRGIMVEACRKGAIGLGRAPRNCRGLADLDVPSRRTKRVEYSAFSNVAGKGSDQQTIGRDRIRIYHPKRTSVKGSTHEYGRGSVAVCNRTLASTVTNTERRGPEKSTPNLVKKTRPDAAVPELT